MSKESRRPSMGRREFVGATATGLAGATLAGVPSLGALTKVQPRRSVIYIFLSGGLAQHESFDMKPDAPSAVRGEFQPIATRTPGLAICEYLPLLAQRSERWSLVRSLTHAHNEHSEGHHIMLTGRAELPPAFNGVKPQSTDFPSIAAVAGRLVPSVDGLPSAAVLPEGLIHRTGRVIPGQFGGQMGPRHDPWLIDAAAPCSSAYGACPKCFHHERKPFVHTAMPVFQAPNLRLLDGVSVDRLERRRTLLDRVDAAQRPLESQDPIAGMRRYRESALGLLTSGPVRSAFELEKEPPRVLDAYGRNKFGWSLLLARRLVEIGVAMVQVHLGNNETWDTHQAAWPNLKEHLLPPTDLAVSALLDDLAVRGMLESTLVVMAGEFGRTPRISTIPGARLAGRDHWGAVQTVWLAGGGAPGGAVIGASDRIGGYPVDAPQTPENLAATMYAALGIPRDAHWEDSLGRPHAAYYADPIAGLEF